MMNLIDLANDKSNQGSIIGGMITALIGNILFVFPILNDIPPVLGAAGALFATGLSTLVVFIVTGVCKRHEKKILDFVDNKIFFLNRKNKRNGKKKGNDQAA